MDYKECIIEALGKANQTQLRRIYNFIIAFLGIGK